MSALDLTTLIPTASAAPPSRSEPRAEAGATTEVAEFAPLLPEEVPEELLIAEPVPATELSLPVAVPVPQTAALRAELGLAPGAEPALADVPEGAGEILPDPAPLDTPLPERMAAGPVSSDAPQMPVPPSGPIMPVAAVSASAPEPVALPDEPEAPVPEMAEAPPEEKLQPAARPVPEPLAPVAPKAAQPFTAASAPTPETAAIHRPEAVILPDAAPESASALAPAGRAPAEPSPLMRNLQERLAEVELAEGQTRFLLRPRGLGAVEIELTRLADGRMNLVMRLENPLVLESLRQEAGQLGAHLAARGFDLGGGDPQFDRWQPPKPQKDAPAPAGGEASAQPDADESTAPPAALGAGRLNLVT